MNVHTPERHPLESQAQYRERQAISKWLAKQMKTFIQFATGFGKHRPHRIAKRQRDMGQHPKFPEPRVRKPGDPIKPTWPKSDDQRAQSRPVHNLNPNREREASKREKPKSAVAKRMDRPERVAMIDRGHAKLMRFLGIVNE